MSCNNIKKEKEQKRYFRVNGTHTSSHGLRDLSACPDAMFSALELRQSNNKHGPSQGGGSAKVWFWAGINRTGMGNGE